MSFSGKHPLPRRSGQQQEVLSLYKSLLMAAQEKEHPPTVSNLKSQIRAEFRQEKTLERKHITKIEWLVHRGRNKLEDIKAMTNTSRFTVFGG
jgi:succinate dehydrogenase assembly factor 1